MEDRYNVECCDFIHAHEGIVEQVRLTLPGEDTLYDLTELFRIFADSTRVRILYVLFESEMCVCDIAALLGMTQSAISHQLRALKNARLTEVAAAASCSERSSAVKPFRISWPITQMRPPTRKLLSRSFPSGDFCASRAT